MKNLFALIVLFLLAGTATYAQPADNNELELEETVKVEALSVTGFDYEFENDKDSLTLVPFKTGTVTLSWTGIITTSESVIFKYRALNTNVWMSLNVNPEKKELQLKGVDENVIFEFAFVSQSDGNTEIKENGISYYNSFGESLFKNNSAKGKEEAAEIMWALPNNRVNEILSIYPEATYCLKYNTKIGDKQHKADEAKSPWTKVDDVDINSVKHKLDPLTGGEKFVYKIGLDLGEKTIWSKKSKFETERAWGIFRLLVLIGALGMFIFGMKIMSEGLQQAAGSRLQNMLGRITSNRFKGVLTGVGITSVVQSSSVTTVMVVSFVNAGLMTLRQSVGVMMGANIGTTMTAWLILVFGFKVSISSYALILIAFGAPMLFFSKGKIKIWASVIIGFALLFMGLGELKDAVPSLGVDSGLVQFFIKYKDAGLLGTLMFIGLGTLVTVVIQSSSAAMALTMTMVAGGVLPFEVAAAMILGENIGTTITAQLAALIGNVHAKRAARIHALFNLIGVFWMILVFHMFLDGIAYFMDGDPFKDPNAANFGIAIFHTTFNVANVLLLIWFTPRLVAIAEKSVRSKGAADEEFHLDYIGTGMMGTPDLSILEAKKEVAKFGAITGKMSGFTQNLLTEQNNKAKTKLHSKIAKYEEITDRVEIEVGNYLSKVSEGEMSEITAVNIRSMHSIVNDLERIGDVFYQMSKAIERKDEEKVYFLPEQRDSLQGMFDLVDKAFDIMIENLNADWAGVSTNSANDAEVKINNKRDEMRKEHLENLSKKDFNMESGMVFNNLFSSCEKVGDHIINVSEAIVGKV